MWYDRKHTRKTFFATLEYFLNNFQGKIGPLISQFYDLKAVVDGIFFIKNVR